MNFKRIDSDIEHVRGEDLMQMGHDITADFIKLMAQSSDCNISPLIIPVGPLNPYTREAIPWKSEHTGNAIYYSARRCRTQSGKRKSHITFDVHPHNGQYMNFLEGLEDYLIEELRKGCTEDDPAEVSSKEECVRELVARGHKSFSIELGFEGFPDDLPGKAIPLRQQISLRESANSARLDPLLAGPKENEKLLRIIHNRALCALKDIMDTERKVATDQVLATALEVQDWASAFMATVDMDDFELDDKEKSQA